MTKPETEKLLELAATFETCVEFLPWVGRRNVAKAVADLREIAMSDGEIVFTKSECVFCDLNADHLGAPCTTPDMVRVSPPITDEMIERFADAYYGRGKTYEPERVRVALSFATAKPYRARLVPYGNEPDAAPDALLNAAVTLRDAQRAYMHERNTLGRDYIKERLGKDVERAAEALDTAIAHARSAGGEGK